MLAFPHEWLQNHSNVPVGVFVKINSCRPSLRFLRVAASSNPSVEWDRLQAALAGNPAFEATCAKKGAQVASAQRWA